jgi:hypothetical protein
MISVLFSGSCEIKGVNIKEVYAQEQQRIAEETNKIPHQHQSLESIPGLMLLLD